MKNKKILVDMSATLIHHGHIRLLKKAFNYNSSRYLIIKDWIDNNLPSDQSERTRRDILKFFKENRITFKEISDTGF